MVGGYTLWKQKGISLFFFCFVFLERWFCEGNCSCHLSHLPGLSFFFVFFFFFQLLLF